MTAEIMAQGSRIIKQETPIKLIKTVDLYSGCTPHDRMVLYCAEREHNRLGIRLLNERN